MAITSYDNAVLALSPTNYWKLDEASGNYADSVGAVPLTSRTATPYPTYEVSTGLVGVGNGVQFGVTSASSAWGVAGALTQVTTDKFSVVGWWNITAIASFSTPLFCASYSGGHVDPFYSIFLGRNGGSGWRVAIARGSGFLPADGGTLGPPEGLGWSHIALVYDGSNGIVYLNGAADYNPVLTGNVDAMGSWAINDIPALDAAPYASGSSSSRVAYWHNTALTAPQIAALYATRNTLYSAGDPPTPVPPMIHGRGAA